MSDIFELLGIKWYFLFIPESGKSCVSLYLCIAELPPNISDIILYYKLMVNVIDVAKSYTIRSSSS